MILRMNEEVKRKYRKLLRAQIEVLFVGYTWDDKFSTDRGVFILNPGKGSP